jgi:hypothetical protein
VLDEAVGDTSCANRPSTRVGADSGQTPEFEEVTDEYGFGGAGDGAAGGVSQTVKMLVDVAWRQGFAVQASEEGADSWPAL